MGDRYAAGRDYGLWLDDDTAELQVFGEFWTYNLPQVDGVSPIGNTKVIALEELEVDGIRPEAGGFMLGDQGQLIGIGHYDLGYWASFPPDAQPPGPPPEILIPPTTTGLLDLAGGTQMGLWVLDSTGAPQLGYISPLSPGYDLISAGTFTYPKPAGGGYTSIAVGMNCVYLLDAAGQITTFGFVQPTSIYPIAADGIYIKLVASTSHVAGITDQGKIHWWSESPSDPDTITAIQTPPAGKGYTDVEVGEDFTYAIIPLGAGAGLAPLAAGEECDTFDRADLGTGWTTGPLFKEGASTGSDTVIVNSIVDGALVAGENNQINEVYGSIRTTEAVPAGDTQIVEATIGNLFPGKTPGLGAGPDQYQIAESEWFLLTNVQDTPVTPSQTSGLNACIGVQAIIMMNTSGANPDVLSVWIEFFSVDEFGVWHFDYTGVDIPNVIPQPNVNGDYVVRLETDPDGTSRIYFQGALVHTEVMPTTGGTHVGVGSQWNMTNYDGQGSTRTPTPSKASTVCGTGVVSDTIDPDPGPGPGPGPSPALPSVPSQVRGFGSPLGATAGSFVVLVPDGHTAISQGPPVGTWGFAVVNETNEYPFGITTFGDQAPEIPPADEGPDAPKGFRVIDYRFVDKPDDVPPVQTNEVVLRWEPSLDGLPAEFYEITRTPVVAGAPPLEPPDGTETVFVRHIGTGPQTYIYKIPWGTHEQSYYMIRAIGTGGIVSGGVSSWVTTKYDNTLRSENAWRKVFITLIEADCQRGGYIMMLQIDQVELGQDGWTGAEVSDENVPPGIYYYEVGKHISVARQSGTNIGTQTSSVMDVNGLLDIEVPPAPTGFVTAIVDYEINIERNYVYWVHETGGGTTEGQTNGIEVPPLLDVCRSEIPSPPHYLRCLTMSTGHVTSDFCLGHLDQLEYQVRSGVFSVIGRPAPVVVVDSRSTASGQLIFLSHGQESEARAQLHTLREMLRMGHPMMLQTEDHYELAEGQLYFQPTSVTDRWVGDDARRPEHALEVQFIEIDPPRGRVVLNNIGLPLTTPVASILKKPVGYLEYPDHMNPLFDMKYCDGGMLEQFRTCDDVLRKSGSADTLKLRTFNELFHTPDKSTCDVPV